MSKVVAVKRNSIPLYLNTDVTTPEDERVYEELMRTGLTTAAKLFVSRSLGQKQYKVAHALLPRNGSWFKRRDTPLHKAIIVLRRASRTTSRRNSRRWNRRRSTSVPPTCAKQTLNALRQKTSAAPQSPANADGGTAIAKKKRRGADAESVPRPSNDDERVVTG